MNPIERPLTATEREAVTSILQTITAAKEIHPQENDVYVWNELDRYSSQIGAPRTQVESYILEEWFVKMTEADWRIYELMASLLLKLQPVVETRAETEVRPELYISWLAAQALGEKGWGYRPDTHGSMRRRAEVLRRQLKELEEAQKISPETWYKEFTI